MKILIPLVAITCLFSIGSTQAETPALNTLSESEKTAGWKLLFDGQNPAESWRSYKKQGFPSGWVAEEGALVQKSGGGDIITKDQFGEFELALEYRISEGGNSGIMIRVQETKGAPWHTGPEIQVLDNLKGRDPQRAGFMYQLYPATKDATKPAGEWNALRILITKEKCEHYMNGEKICEYVIGSADWNERVAKSKFKAFPEFGKHEKGHICLQDHGDLVSYRNIKIRPINP